MDRTSPAARNASDTEVIDHKLYCTLFIYLAYEYSKHFVQPVLQPVANCKRTFRRQCLSDCRATGQKSFPRSCERAKAVNLPVNFVRPAAAYPPFCVILRRYVTCLSVCASVCIVRCGLDNLLLINNHLSVDSSLGAAGRYGSTAPGQ